MNTCDNCRAQNSLDRIYFLPNATGHKCNMCNTFTERDDGRNRRFQFDVF